MNLPNLPEAALWGLLATLVLTLLLSGSQGLRLTRLSMSYLVGSIFTPNRDAANALGTVVHFVNGLLFAFLYAAVFQSLGQAGWALGAVMGLCHGLVMLVILVPMLPGLHPRMASEQRGPTPTRDLEPPGFLSMNYGRRTPVIVILAHVIYGAMLGAFYHVQ